MPLSVWRIAATNDPGRADHLSGDVLYPTYGAAPRVWGLAPLTDQQIGGLIMWIPGALVFFTVLTIVFMRWLNRDEYEPSPDTGRITP